MQVVDCSWTFSHCDSESLPATTKVTNLVPNTFYKICPGVNSAEKFGHPQCGDGTPFSFYVSRPLEKYDNGEKVLIEFQGGGACWDAQSCNRMADRLTFPEDYDNFVGYSCSEVDLAMTKNGQDGMSLSMLCTKSSSETGGVNLREYNTVIIPYCTQDVHLGDNIIQYGDDGQTTAHKGASNMLSTLRWIYGNFPSPSHIVLTGCSAGGTVLPVAYDLISSHYNSRLSVVRSTQVSVIADSAVYLTPSYFLENAFENWNPFSILKKTGFNYDRYRYNEEFPTKLWDYILSRGSNRDSWGFLTHIVDPVSLYYYEAMNGNNGDNNYDEDESNQWWENLSSSLTTLQASHGNFKTFFIDDEEGHCSFGLYYGFLQEGFGEWVGSVLKEKLVLGKQRPAVISLIFAIVFGTGITIGLIKSKRHKNNVEVDESELLEEARSVKKPKSLLPRWFSSRFMICPITAGYMGAITFYFLAMILTNVFAHPLINPSLGPSAKALSSHGINNPTLIVYDLEIWRLITSTFLSSGVIAYFVVMIFCWKYLRYIEERLNDTLLFTLILSLLVLGFNLIYACLREGASCGSIAMVIGMNAFSITMVKRRVDEGREQSPIFFPSPWIATGFVFILASVILPFNNWIMLGSAILLGFLLGQSVQVTGKERIPESSNLSNSAVVFSKKALSGFLLFYSFLFSLLVMRVIRPDRLYENPYYTGCNLMYTDKATDIVSKFSGGDGNDQRYLNNNNNESPICAEFCIPHIASYGTEWGVERYLGITLEHGLCEDAGFSDFFIAKTFTYWSFTLDVELFYSSSDYGDRIR